MRFVLPILILWTTAARAEDAPPSPPPDVAAPVAWGKASFQDPDRAEMRKLADDLLGEKSTTPAQDKNDNSSSK